MFFKIFHELAWKLIELFQKNRKEKLVAKKVYEDIGKIISDSIFEYKNIQTVTHTEALKLESMVFALFLFNLLQPFPQPHSTDILDRLYDLYYKSLHKKGWSSQQKVAASDLCNFRNKVYWGIMKDTKNTTALFTEFAKNVSEVSNVKPNLEDTVFGHNLMTKLDSQYDKYKLKNYPNFS